MKKKKKSWMGRDERIGARKAAAYKKKQGTLSKTLIANRRAETRKREDASTKKALLTGASDSDIHAYHRKKKKKKRYQTVLERVAKRARK